MIELSTRVALESKAQSKARLSSTLAGRMRRTVELLGAEAKRLCPRRTGRLVASICWEVSEDGLTGWYGSNRPWRGEDSVPYAVFMEMGFYHARAGRFIGPFPPPYGYLRGALHSKWPEVERIWRGKPPEARVAAEVRY